MVLTRHLYSLDEVHAALVYSSQRSDCSETIFWCRELIDSGYAAEAISTLFSAWMWHRGPFDLQWLVRAATTLASDAVTEEDILVSAHHLSQRCMRDHSLWTVLTSAVPDRVTPRTPACSHIFGGGDPKELFFFRALYQGKATSAWWMARHLEPSRVWELLSAYVESSLYAESYRVCFQVLQHYESLLGYRVEDSNILCLAVLSACLSPAQQEKSFRVLPEPLLVAPMEDTIRRSRRYSIPTACLYGDTARGRMTWSQSTLRSLREMELSGPFWDEHKWTTEEEREAFYDRFFPDPPDEWTLAEQQRSHGDGVLSDIGCTMEKYARLFLSHTSRLAWSENVTPVGPYPGTIWVSVPPLQDVDVAFLVPVVRRLRIV